MFVPNDSKVIPNFELYYSITITPFQDWKLINKPKWKPTLFLLNTQARTHAVFILHLRAVKNLHFKGEKNLQNGKDFQFLFAIIREHYNAKEIKLVYYENNVKKFTLNSSLK